MTFAALRSLGRLLVPPACVCCGAPQAGLDVICIRCRARLVALPALRCARCGAPSGRDVPACPECRGRRLAFARAWAAFAYNPGGRALVAALKSRGLVAVARLMGAEIAARAPAQALAGSTALVPVPAHPRRIRRDGFNPAALVAEHAGRALGLPVLDLLRRCGRAPPQAQLGRVERLRMAAGAVQTRPVRVPPGRLVLIDDVYTTGATANACARALRAAGAEQVVALAFARAVRTSGPSQND